MAKKIFKKETSELIVSVVADKNIWKKEQEKAEKFLISNVSVKGFRKGKVPINIAKQSISQTNIFSKAIKGILNVLVKEAAEIIKDEFILDGPSYNIQRISNVDLEVDFIYPIYPEIKMPDYKNMGVKLKAIKEDKSLVDLEMQKLQKQHALLIDKDIIQKGYIVNLDYEGFVDGKTFEGGKGEKFNLEIGSKQFIPGFEDQMIGLKKGDKPKIKLTFPKDYTNKELKGKDVVFQVIINNVHEKILPKLDDKFAKESGIANVTTLKELQTHIKNFFKQQATQQAKFNFQKDIFAKIKDKTQIIIPSQLLIKETQIIAQQFEENLKKQSLDKNQYMKLAGIDQATLNSQFKLQSEERLKDSLIFAEIAKNEKIELTEKDYKQEYAKLAKIHSQTEKAIKGMITKPQMQIPMTNDRVIDILIKYNK